MEGKVKSYFEVLEDATKNCEQYEGVLKYLPDFYIMLCNIACNKKSDWYTKMLVNSALSYLVLEEDVIPDSEKDKGYLDDLFLCIYVLKEIRDNISKEVILINLKGTKFKEDRVLDLIYTVFKISSSYLDSSEKILNLIGLKSFNSFDLRYSEESSRQINIYQKKKQLVHAMLAVKAKNILKFPDTNPNSKIEHLKRHILEHPEFLEIQKFMEFID